MIWNDLHFFSEALGIQTAAYVLLPDAEVMLAHAGEPLPTMYLLHGLSDDHTCWLRYSRIEKYADTYYVAVVMPAVNRSFYADMVHGAKYWTYISEELPRMLEQVFPLCRERSGRFAAGLSMGGYGAMKLGLALPGRYGAVAALSAPLWLHVALDGDIDAPFQKDLMDIFGDREGLINGIGNLDKLADALDALDAPRIYAACGTADFLYEANEIFMAKYQQKFNIRYERELDAAHTWPYWDHAIRDVLAWLPLQAVHKDF